ncbi:putative RNA-directed DNA polymerase from transposon X-element [Trichonephila inaurata madagascariensis]|uniref:Putative RNA-directed DNA polymerase from transposon X-element n=1 Tax=Trichonephila inaurata madagascariensis TaxID=2747483 RepID=A0A8X6WLY6_9ARAC|nr:putative RNA-directed DNA polymerase from transposon X-element [Trichonephila inaurata madagascariensis]
MLRLVSGFPPTKENYSKAVQQVKERFGREDLLVQIYIRDLLGRTQEKFADFLKLLVESCLPEAVLRTWERCRNVDPTSEGQGSGRTLDRLITFLSKEVESEEMVLFARPRNVRKTKPPQRSHLWLQVLLSSTQKETEKVTETEIETDAYYLSHRAVFKNSETIKIRPVSDATAREGNNPSLNGCLLRVPNLSILILIYSINHLLDNTPSKYMDIVSKLHHSFYVDNCVTGVSDTQEIESFVNKVREIMSK